MDPPDRAPRARQSRDQREVFLLARTRRRERLACVECSLPLLVAGEDERYQAEVLRLAPAPKLDPRAAARGEGAD